MFGKKSHFYLHPIRKRLLRPYGTGPSHSSESGAGTLALCLAAPMMDGHEDKRYSTADAAR
jgi:hypothetical protein